jgi:hypothetical protein
VVTPVAVLDRLYESRIQVEWIGVITFSLGEVDLAPEAAAAVLQRLPTQGLV